MIKPPRIRQRPCATAEATRPSLLHHNLRLVTVYKPIGEIRPPVRALRKHGKRQIAALKASVSEFGILKPILLNPGGQIVAGHGVWQAAKELGMSEVPTISIEHLSPEQLRLYAISDNQIQHLEAFDDEVLRLELGELTELSLNLDLDLNLELTGLATSQIDDILTRPAPSSADDEGDEADDLPEVPVEPITRSGDVWLCGKHKLLCGSPLETESYRQLLGEERAQLVVSDALYNVTTNGNVAGRGRHEEFAMTSGEISASELTSFFATGFGNQAAFSVDGSIHFQFMDWRHMGEMLAAGEQAYTELKNLLIWDKQSAGLGSFYRSQHELIFVWKNGTAPGINNFGFGETGRWRSNVLSYPGSARLRKGRDADLAAHPTVKNLSLVSDLVRDCSNRGAIVLDAFGGAGTTMAAAELTGRRARLIELEPRYCDVAIKRWEKITGEEAVLASSGQTFADVEAERCIASEEA